MFFGNPTPHAAAKGYTQVLTGRLTAARNYDVVGDLLVIRIFFYTFPLLHSRPTTDIPTQTRQIPPHILKHRQRSKNIKTLIEPKTL